MIYLLLAIILILIILYLFALRRYRRHTWSFVVDKNIIEFFKPVGLLMYDLLEKRISFSQDKTKIYQLYGRFGVQERYKHFMVLRISLVYCIILLFSILSLVYGVTLDESPLITTKPAYEEGKRIEFYHYEIKDQESDYSGNLQVEIPTIEPTQKEVDNYLKQVIQQVEEQLCPGKIGELETYYDLSFPETYLGVSIDWISQDKNYLLSSGRIRQEKLTEITQVRVDATYSYYDFILTKTYKITLHPQPLTINNDHLEETLRDSIKKASTNEVVVLPSKIQGYQVNWSGDTNWLSPIRLFLMGLVVAVLFYFLKAKALDEHMVKRKEEILIRLPNLINKIALLIQAGMTFNNAWQKVVEDYRVLKNNTGIRYELYEEMLITQNDIAAGTDTLKAYELFAKRLGCKEVFRFITIITQNIKKGNHMLSNALLELSYHVWQQRAQRAKIKGEKASTKMVFPMVILLVVVMMMILTPAYLTLQF